MLDVDCPAKYLSSDDNIRNGSGEFKLRSEEATPPKEETRFVPSHFGKAVKLFVSYLVSSFNRFC